MKCTFKYKDKEFGEKEFRKEYFSKIHTELYKEGKEDSQFVFDRDSAFTISRDASGMIRNESLRISLLYDSLKHNIVPGEAKDLYASIRFLDEQNLQQYVDTKQKHLKEDGKAPWSIEKIRSEYYSQKVRKDNNGEFIHSMESIDAENGQKVVIHSIIDNAGSKVILGKTENGTFHTDKHFKTLVTQFSNTKAIEESIRQEAIKKQETRKVKVDKLTKAFKRNGINVNVVEDLSINVNGRIDSVEDKSVTIKINPDRLQNDTDVHEFGHIYVDLLGEDHALIKKAMDQVRGTSYWNRIKKNNPNKSDAWVDKETVVTAIGLEGTKILDEKARTKFKVVVDNIFRFIADKLGIKQDYVKRLAFDLVEGRFEKGMHGEILSGWEQGESMLAKDLGDKDYQDSIEVNDEINKYINKKDGSMWERVTKFVHDTFSWSNTVEISAGKMADYKYAMKVKDANNNIKDRETIYEEELSKLKEYAAEGKFGHLIMEFSLSSDPYRRQEIQKEMDELRSNPQKYGKINDKKFTYLFNKNGYFDENKLRVIFEKMGLNILSEKANPAEPRDKFIVEGKFINKKFGLGRTIDLAVEKSNGQLVFVDYKFWKNFHSNDHQNLLKNTGDIPDYMADNNFGRAQLELTLSMLMYKEMHPEAKWSQALISHITRDASQFAEIYEVDVKNNLEILRNHYMDTNPALFKELNDRNLFDVNEYGGLKGTVMDMDKSVANLPHDKQVRHFELQIEQLDDKQLKRNKLDSDIFSSESIENKDGTGKITTYKTWGERRKELLKQLGDIRNEVSLTDAKESDMPFWRKYFGSIYDVRSKNLILFRDTWFEVKFKLDKIKDDINKEFNDHAEFVAKEYYGKNYLKRLGLQSTNIGEVWGWALKSKSEAVDGKEDKIGIHLLTEADAEFKALPKERQELIRFIRDSMNERYKKLMSQVMFYNENGTAVTRAEYFGKDKELPEDFFPVIGIEMDEVREVHGMFSGESIEGTFRKMALQVFDTKDYQQETARDQIELNGVGVKAEANRARGNHTRSVEKAYKEFMMNMAEVEHLEPVLKIGEAIRMYYKSQVDPKYPNAQKSLFENNAEWMDGMINQLIFNQKKELHFSSHALHFTWNLPWGFDKGTVLYIKPDKFINMLRNFTSFTFMAFNFVGAGFNAALNIGLTHMEAMKGEIAKWSGVKPEDIDFDMKTMLQADADVFGLMGAWVKGDSTSNKLHQIARKTDYLTNNYDFRIRSELYLTPKNKFWDSSMFYSFYKMSEDFSNYGVLAAQLRMMKYTDKNGVKKSLWEGYDDKGEWTGDIRGKVKVKEDATGKVEYKDLMGLDYKEVMHLKRVSNRIWGNYRMDERILLEQYSWGRMLMQFKKFMPVIMNTIYQGKFDDSTMGTFKLTGEEVEGQKVYDFQNRVNNGRMRVLLNWIFYHTAGIGAAPSKRVNYKWETMPAEYKQHLINAGMTAMLLFPAIFMMQKKDGEKETVFDVRLKRLMTEDFAQGWNPQTFLNALSKNNMMAIQRAMQFSSGLSNLFLHGVLMGERTQDGRMPGATDLWRTTPFFGVAATYSRYMDQDFQDNPAVKFGESLGLTTNEAWLPKTRQ